MYHLHTFIDAVQRAKRDTFNSLVKDPELRTIADKYLEAQTQFAKTVIDAGWDFVEDSVKKANKAFSTEYFPQAPYKVEPKESKKQSKKDTRTHKGESNV